MSFIGRLIVAVFALVVRCYALSLYWVWFVLSVFPTVPIISGLQFFALWTFYGVFTTRIKDEDFAEKPEKPGKTEKEKWVRTVSILAVWLFSIPFGWLYHCVFVALQSHGY